MHRQQWKALNGTFVEGNSKLHLFDQGKKKKNATINKTNKIPIQTNKNR